MQKSIFGEKGEDTAEDTLHPEILFDHFLELTFL